MPATTSDLIETLAGYVACEKRSNFVIFGSAAIELCGVDLGRAIDDLDIFVSEETFTSLKKFYTEQTKLGGDRPVPYFQPAPKIEILKSFPGVSFDEVHKNAKPVNKSCGFPVGSINDLLKWKNTQGRNKDISDIEAIKRQRPDVSE